MTGREHRATAVALLAQVLDMGERVEVLMLLTAVAQVHALLALTADHDT